MQDTEDTEMCSKKVCSGYDLATALINSLQLWLSAEDKECPIAP